jgi:hypothetical protein
MSGCLLIPIEPPAEPLHDLGQSLRREASDGRLRDEHLAIENRILKAQLKGRLLLTGGERATLGEIGHRGR